VSNIITIGNQPESKITAYGDDSKFNNTIAFAYVLFENPKIETARHSLLCLKEKYRIPSKIPLHMRLLNNFFYRKKNDLQHLTASLLDKLVSDIIDEMNKLPFMVKGSFFSGEMPKDLEDDGQGLSVEWSDKGIQSMLAKSALTPLNLEKYQYKDLRIIIAEDKTVQKFLGKNKRQAARWARGFSSIEAPPGYVYEFDPIIQKSSEEILLQLADIMVYAIAHTFNEKASNSYREQLEKVRNINVQSFMFSPSENRRPTQRG